VKLLLDTQALLWWLGGDARLGAAAAALIEDPANDVLVSVASLWEIVVKRRVGKLEADVGEVATAAKDQGLALLDIALPHLMVLEGLQMHHRDPFDHLLIAQALAEEAAFLTADGQAAAYPVRVVPATA